MNKKELNGIKKSSEKNSWGGAREGAGRKSIYSEPMQDFHLLYPKSLVVKLQRVADANGISLAQQIRNFCEQGLGVAKKS